MLQHCEQLMSVHGNSYQKTVHPSHSHPDININWITSGMPHPEISFLIPAYLSKLRRPRLKDHPIFLMNKSILITNYLGMMPE